MDTKNTAFVFPGQGSQYVGMGSVLFREFSEVRELFESADEILKKKLSSLILDGPAEELKITENTQPAILLVSTAFGLLLKKKERVPVAVAGHSLGEYSALVHNGCLSFEDALRLVRLRGKFMQEAVPVGFGTMYAIVGLDDSVVEDVCRETSAQGDEVVSPANYNCPGQLVIAGHTNAAARAAEECKKRGARMCVQLEVSAPFHCELLKPAAVKLSEELSKVSYNDFEIPYYANVDAERTDNASLVRDKLVRQVTSPVLWKQSIEGMIASGLERFVEVGPGKVLCGLIKKTNRKVETVQLDSEKAMEEWL